MEIEKDCNSFKPILGTNSKCRKNKKIIIEKNNKSNYSISRPFKSMNTENS